MIIKHGQGSEPLARNLAKVVQIPPVGGMLGEIYSHAHPLGGEETCQSTLSSFSKELLLSAPTSRSDVPGQKYQVSK